MTTRRVVWTLIVLISLITVLWQWENWRSARELKAVHQRVIERLGTDDPFAFMPPTVTDEQNYFANPLIESWLNETKPGTLGTQYKPPPDVLVPKDFIMPEIVESDDGGPGRLDLKAWMAKRAAPEGEDAVTTLSRELAQHQAMLQKLAAGVNKPYSIMKPGQREATEAAGGNPWEAAIPQFQNINRFQRQLGLHLRLAAMVEDNEKTAMTAQIMLRFSEAPARGGIIGILVPLALHEITFDALHEALEHPAWTEESLSRLQVRLGQFDELENYEKSFGGEITGMFAGLYYFRSHPEALMGRSVYQPGWKGMVDRAFEFAMIRGPIGWHDANIAFYADCMLEQLGPAGKAAWLTAAARDEKVRLLSKHANSWPNPRRILGAIAIPNVGNISRVAAETLFHRRCLIIACALEKHRLRHGAFPDSLEVVKEDLKLFTLDDPARPGHLPCFRLEKSGYLLWSAGPDAKDDGGVKDKDWLWRRP
ncbi:MAG: hypothetical protein ACK5TH_08460 [Prosthecobacter sp.]